MLAPHAVYCISKALAESGAAFAYSDEALFEKTPEHPRVGHFKPDYAPEYLMAVNYICHLAVFKKSLFDAVGGERPACDGAQAVSYTHLSRTPSRLAARQGTRASAAAYPAGSAAGRSAGGS